MDTKEFTRELAKRKGISEQTAYRYINSVMWSNVNKVDRKKVRTK